MTYSRLYCARSFSAEAFLGHQSCVVELPEPESLPEDVEAPLLDEMLPVAWLTAGRSSRPDELVSDRTGDSLRGASRVTVTDPPGAELERTVPVLGVAAPGGRIVKLPTLPPPLPEVELDAPLPDEESPGAARVLEDSERAAVASLRAVSAPALGVEGIVMTCGATAAVADDERVLVEPEPTEVVDELLPPRTAVLLPRVAGVGVTTTGPAGTLAMPGAGSALPPPPLMLPPPTLPERPLETEGKERMLGAEPLVEACTLPTAELVGGSLGSCVAIVTFGSRGASHLGSSGSGVLGVAATSVDGAGAGALWKMLPNQSFMRLSMPLSRGAANCAPASITFACNAFW